MRWAAISTMWWCSVGAWAAVFGGKESQPALIACAAAVLARQTGRAVKLRLDREADMRITGKRHDFVADYDGRLR